MFGRDVVVPPQPQKELYGVSRHRHVYVDHMLNDRGAELVWNFLNLKHYFQMESLYWNPLL